jgi:hypothetical protein
MVLEFELYLFWKQFGGGCELSKEIKKISMFRCRRDNFFTHPLKETGKK